MKLLSVSSLSVVSMIDGCLPRGDTRDGVHEEGDRASFHCKASNDSPKRTMNVLRKTAEGISAEYK